jgi:predicted CopG family antitoxin
MKTLSVTISDEAFKKFVRVQEKRGFRNQSDLLEWVIKRVAEQEEANDIKT